jgi:large subunit ribosomal protein L3
MTLENSEKMVAQELDLQGGELVTQVAGPQVQGASNPQDRRVRDKNLVKKTYKKTLVQTKFIKADARPGIVAEKLGMTSDFAQDGNVTPVTVLKVLNATIIETKTVATHGYDAVVIGYGAIKDKKISKPMAGCFKKLQVSSFAHVREFRVGENYQQSSSSLDSSCFAAGEFVDVCGISIGKGFAGGMKRWNFRGLEASHGVSVSHRSHGSTGQRQDPGKVFKGKKMAGHMGSRRVTSQNLKILKVDLENGLLIIKGSIPGSKGGKVFITDAKKKIKVA